MFSSGDLMTSIAVGRNKIQHVSPNMIEAYPRLRTLDLSFNEIKTVRITSNSSLTYLNLDGNNLTLNESVFSTYMPQLSKLRLSRNHLTSIGFSFIENLQCEISRNCLLDVSFNSLNDVQSLLPSP